MNEGSNGEGEAVGNGVESAEVVIVTVPELTTEKLKAELKARESARIALLPLASAEMLNELCGSARGVLMVKTDWLNKTHRLDADGAERVEIAKAEHRIYINRVEARAEITEIVCKAKRLTAFKYAITEKGVKFKVAGIATRCPKF